MAEPYQEKTEPATDKKRQDAREKGQVAKTRELPSVMTLMAGLMLFYFLSYPLLQSLLQLMASGFKHSSEFVLNPENAYTLLLMILKGLASFMIPLFAVIFVSGLAGNVAQVGFLLTSQPLLPKFSKIDPLKGFSRLISKQTFAELFKSIMKIAIIAVIAYQTVSSEGEKFPGLINLEVSQIFTYTMQILFKLGFRVALVLIGLALFDYGFQRWSYEKDLRMTKEEVKEEFKQREGDPMIKSRIRSIQRQMARKRMMEAVPRADVVITNPTHYAVALEYQRERMIAPVVTAKGTGFLAQKIRQIAEENRVPLVEDKFLAQALYKDAELGEAVPVVLYKAVAEILAYVYKLKKRF